MKLITARNVNGAYTDGLWWLRVSGVQEQTRNGWVKASPEPVCTTYKNPWERVLWNKQRDANPFFHLAEAIWMLAGSMNLPWLERFNSNMASFSDNGRTLRGAYGYRWREWFEYDQLKMVIGLLKEDPTTRRAVLSMWDPREDLGAVSKDVPCNTHCYFRIKDAALETTLCCRSNDMIWGAYGANAVHFSVLHEFIARAVGVRMGPLIQISNNFHIYERHWELLDIAGEPSDPYNSSAVPVLPLIAPGETWTKFLLDCEDMVAGGSPVRNAFLMDVAGPMLTAYLRRKDGIGGYMHLIDAMPHCDWKLAAMEWLVRRNSERSDDEL